MYFYLKKKSGNPSVAGTVLFLKTSLNWDFKLWVMMDFLNHFTFCQVNSIKFSNLDGRLHWKTKFMVSNFISQKLIWYSFIEIKVLIITIIMVECQRVRLKECNSFINYYLLCVIYEVVYSWHWLLMFIISKNN